MDDYDPMDKANWFYHFIEVVPEFYHPLCYINTEETCAVNVKTQIESFKNKDGYLNVFQLQYFLYSHIVNSKVYFSCTFYLFFVIILRKRIVSKHWNMYFSTKLTQYYCKCKIKLDSRIFLFLFHGISRTFENLYAFFSFKTQRISNFTIIEKENVPYLQEYTTITW